VAARRVLIVSNLFPPHVVGGAEIVAWRQARQLAARGHHVEVFAGWVSSGPEAAHTLTVEDVDGLRVWRVPVPSFDPDDNFHIPHLVKRLESVIGVVSPEIVHFHNLAGLGYSLIPAVKRLGLTAIVTLHDHAGYCYRATALRPDGRRCMDPEECGTVCRGSIRPRDLDVTLPIRLRRDYVVWALAQADRLISPSASLGAAMRFGGGILSGQIDVLSNGIDLAPFVSPARPDGELVRFLCVAYLGEHKGIADLLDAAAELTAKPDLAGRWSLVIAGDGYMRAQLEAEIDSGRFGGAVTYGGRMPREHIIAEMSRSHVVILPSRWPENEPVVLLEAIAAGVAQLGTDCGGTPSLIERDVTGSLVPPGQPQALAEAMETYIRNPERARRQGRHNWDRRHDFSEENTVRALDAIYDDVRRAPSVRTGKERPLVACAGDWPVIHVAEMCHHLYRLEEPCPGVRLVWHQWLESVDWERVALFWNWSSGANLALFQRALRAGVPILAPASCVPARSLRSSFGAAILYDTFLEGLVALARLPHDEAALGRLRRRCTEAADVLAAGAPEDHFRLGMEALPT
jgi:glycosyltransferase involved in cell wall biosynthesis